MCKDAVRKHMHMCIPPHACLLVSASSHHEIHDVIWWWLTGASSLLEYLFVAGIFREIFKRTGGIVTEGKSCWKAFQTPVILGFILDIVQSRAFVTEQASETKESPEGSVVKEKKLNTWECATFNKGEQRACSGCLAVNEQFCTGVHCLFSVLKVHWQETKRKRLKRESNPDLRRLKLG